MGGGVAVDGGRWKPAVAAPMPAAAASAASRAAAEMSGPVGQALPKPIRLADVIEAERVGEGCAVAASDCGVVGFDGHVSDPAEDEEDEDP